MKKFEEYTLEDILYLPAGNKMNALVAEEIMGIEVVWEDPTGFDYEENFGPCDKNTEDDHGEHEYVKSYSSWYPDTMEMINSKFKNVEFDIFSYPVGVHSMNDTRMWSIGMKSYNIYGYSLPHLLAKWALIRRKMEKTAILD